MKLDVLMEVNDSPKQIELIKNKIVYGIMADIFVKDEEGVVAIPIQDDDMVRDVWAISLKNVYTPGKIRKFYYYISSSLSES